MEKIYGINSKQQRQYERCKENLVVFDFTLKKISKDVHK